MNRKTNPLSTDFLKVDENTWRLEDNLVHVFKVCLDDPALNVNQLAVGLSLDEMDRGSRFRQERDRRDFVIGRGLVRRLLGRYLDRGPGDMVFSYGLHGKPALDFGLDSSLRFNLAHSGRLLVCAVSLNREVGVDIELIKSFPDQDGVAKGVFTLRERAALAEVDGPEKDLLFFQFWTRKEAYIKADGQGFTLPVNQIEIGRSPGESPRLVGEGDGQGQNGSWSIVDFSPGDQYAGALAVEGPLGRVRYWRLDPF